MRTAAVIIARKEAERFLKRIAEYEETENFTDTHSVVGCKEAAAVKRASMDLTRALADLRGNNKKDKYVPEEKCKTCKHYKTFGVSSKCLGCDFNNHYEPKKETKSV